VPRYLSTNTLRRVGAIVLAALLSACSDGSDSVRTFIPELPPQPEPAVRPVVFVHGQSGSAQQFETHAMRFTSNGYPADMLFAFEYDTLVQDNPIADLADFVDAVLDQTGENAVYAIGHSRGTSLWTAYLEDPAFGGPDKVEKYVNIDGQSPEELPGGVNSIGIWGEWNTADSGFNRREDNSDARIGPDPEANFHFADKSHSEVATSAEAFGLIYEFLTGVAARTVDVIEDDSGTVSVSGRVQLFPENTGFEGGSLELWEIDDDSGQRIGDSPVETLITPADGSFGPWVLRTDVRYEFALLREPNETVTVPTVHHFYFERFHHDNRFVRLLSSQPGQSIEGFLPRSDSAAGLVLVRQKEFWGDQGAGSDELFINGLDILTDLIAPRALGDGSGVNLAVFAFDAGGDAVTDLEQGEVFPFSVLTFLSGADVFIPAQAGGSGTTEITLVHRGGARSQMNVPNWPSFDNRVSVSFRDDL
jgi:pimeloyl-ACP methyl ester carboxylesterase